MPKGDEMRKANDELFGILKPAGAAFY